MSVLGVRNYRENELLLCLGQKHYLRGQRLRLSQCYIWLVRFFIFLCLEIIGDPNELVSSYAFSEMEKLKKYLRGLPISPHSRSVCESIFSALLLVKDVPSHLRVFPSRQLYFQVLKETFLIANVILETSTLPELKESAGLIPFVGPPRWPSLKLEFRTNPPFDVTLLSKMASFLTSDICQDQNEAFLRELSKLARNCCLLGDDTTTHIFHSHINHVLHWIEVSAIPASFLSQTMGLLALTTDDDHAAQIWRILNHKIMSSSENVRILALDCATSILIGLLSCKVDDHSLHLLGAHWNLLRQFFLTSEKISLHAAEFIGSLSSIASFPLILGQANGSEVDISELQAIILSKSCESSKVSVILRTLSRIAVSYGSSTKLFLHSWNLLVENSFLSNNQSRVVRFNFAEALVRMAIVDISNDRVAELVTYTEVIAFSSGRSEFEKGSAVLIIRVLLQHFSNFSLDSLDRMSIVILSVIRGTKVGDVPETELFIQDVCCSALCQIFMLSQCIETQYAPSTLLYASAAEKISALVISTLCREKRSLPTAGPFCPSTSSNCHRNCCGW